MPWTDLSVQAYLDSLPDSFVPVGKHGNGGSSSRRKRYVTCLACIGKGKHFGTARRTVRCGCDCQQQATDDNKRRVVPRPLVLRLLMVGGVPIPAVKRIHVSNGGQAGAWSAQV